MEWKYGQPWIIIENGGFMKIIRLNIPRLQFRRDFVAGLLFSREVPLEQMIVWKGRDAADV